MASNLLATRLHAPPARKNFLPRTRLLRILDKLGVRSRTQAVAQARGLNLL